MNFAIIGIVVVIILVVFIFARSRLAPESLKDNLYMQEVRQNPLNGEAKILSAITEGYVGKHEVLYKMKMQITPAQGPVYELSELVPNDKAFGGQWKIPIEFTHKIEEGTILPVVIHPEKREFVYFEFETKGVEAALSELEKQKSRG